MRTNTKKCASVNSSDHRSSAADKASRSSGWTFVIGTTLLPALSMAQSTTPVGAAPDQSAGALAEIIVTAERRSENMQNVPVDVSTLTAAALVSQGITDTSSLNGKIPSLEIVQIGPQNVMYLRGVGSNVAASNAEKSVAMYVDGVYYYAPVGNIFPLSDIDHIEVLKGPQGTLFGRNATAGVVQFFTRDPQQEPSAEIGVGYGNLDTVTGHVYATAGLLDTLAANISINEKNMGDGFGTDVVTGRPTYKTDQFDARAKFLWTPTDSTTVHAVFDYTNVHGSVYDAQVRPGALGLNGVVSTVAPYNTTANWSNSNGSKIFLTAFTLAQDLSFAKLENIISWRDQYEAHFSTDNDSTPLPIVNAVVDQPSKTFTEELRLISRDDSYVKWVGGFFYIDARTYLTPFYLGGLAAAPNPAIWELDAQDDRAFAPYAQVTVPLIADTNLTAGVRYNHEELFHAGTQVQIPLGNVVVPPVPGSQDNNAATWRASLDHKFTQEFMVYVSANTGFKTGGYNLLSPPGTSLPPYKPEHLTAYEVGAKTELFERRVRFNAAGYYYDYKDIQVQADLPAGQLVSNGPSAYFKGIDSDLTTVLVENLTMTAAANYVEGHYGSFPNAVGFPSNPALGSFVFNATGNNTVYTPKWSANLGLDYIVNSVAGQFTMNANLQYSAKAYVEVDNRLTVPSYIVENDSLIWQPSSDSRYAVRLWVLNAFGRQYLSNVQESGSGDLWIWAPPRTYGATFSVKLGKR